MTSEKGAADTQGAAALGGRMADLITAFDWHTTSLGDRENWPQSLKTAVDMILASGHAICLAWGPDRVLFYNDAYSPILGARHPVALGGTLAEAWPEIWDEIAPLVDRTFAGETSTFQDMPLVMSGVPSVSDGS